MARRENGGFVFVVADGVGGGYRFGSKVFSYYLAQKIRNLVSAVDQKHQGKITWEDGKKGCARF